MKYRVFELSSAESDIQAIFEWLREHSPHGAAAWLDAYDRMVASIEERADSFGEAFENPHCSRDVRQAFFKTRRGRMYRALFLIQGDHVYILRVRGPGQAPVDPRDVQP